MDRDTLRGPADVVRCQGAHELSTELEMDVRFDAFRSRPPAEACQLVARRAACGSVRNATVPHAVPSPRRVVGLDDGVHADRGQGSIDQATEGKLVVAHDDVICAASGRQTGKGCGASARERRRNATVGPRHASVREGTRVLRHSYQQLAGSVGVAGTHREKLARAKRGIVL